MIKTCSEAKITPRHVLKNILLKVEKNREFWSWQPLARPPYQIVKIKIFSTFKKIFFNTVSGVNLASEHVLITQKIIWSQFWVHMEKLKKSIFIIKHTRI